MNLNSQKYLTSTLQWEAKNHRETLCCLVQGWHRQKKAEKTEIRKALAQIKSSYKQRALKESMASRQFSYEESKGKLLYNSNVMQENKGNQN